MTKREVLLKAQLSVVNFYFVILVVLFCIFLKFFLGKVCSKFLKQYKLFVKIFNLRKMTNLQLFSF